MCVYNTLSGVEKGIGMEIRVQTASEEKFQEALEALKPLGVEVVTGTEEPLVTALFYLSRLNTKLDNLGQLGHLNKFVRLFKPIVDYYEDLSKERMFQKRDRTIFYLSLLDKSKGKPAILYGNIGYMEKYEILRAFKPHLSKEDYEEALDAL